MKKIFFGLVAVLLISFGATVFVQASSTDTTPMVNITDITNVIYPSPLPGGGPITLTYEITNPGKVSLNDVTVTDDHCTAMSGELGDVNGNHLLDPGETWVYTCATVLTKTTTHAATVTAYANGLKTVATESATVNVPSSGNAYTPNLPDSGSNPNVPGLPNNGTNPGTLNITVLIWECLGGIFVVLIIIYFVITRKKQ